MIYLQGSSSTANSLVYQAVNSSTTTSITSTTFTTTGLNITVLETGTYRVDYAINLHYAVSGSLNKRAESALFLNGSIVAGTTAQTAVQLSGISLASTGIDGNNTMFCIANLVVGDVLDIRIRNAGNNVTLSALHRQLMIIKVG